MSEFELDVSDLNLTGRLEFDVGQFELDVNRFEFDVSRFEFDVAN